MPVEALAKTGEGEKGGDLGKPSPEYRKVPEAAWTLGGIDVLEEVGRQNRFEEQRVSTD